MDDLNAYQITFWFCALLGTGMFIVNTIISLVSGIDNNLDISSHEVSHEGISSPDSAFQLISLTSLTGFVMMFGWVGLASYEQMQLGILAALACALAAGIGTMYLTAYIFKAAKGLISAGAVFDITQAVGKTATVYSRIPSQGKGQIQIIMSGMTHEIDAISETHSEIESNSSVQVVMVVDKTTLAVKPII